MDSALSVVSVSEGRPFALVAFILPGHRFIMYANP
jgi:hypothetical protein